MSLTRRTFGLGAGAAGAGLALPAIAQNRPLSIGFLVPLTGPISAAAAGLQRGTELAIDTLNQAGGIKGRKLELVTRDTQGDPSKAVNASQQMISDKVVAIWGPASSGESLAVTPLLARAKMPNIHQCVIDSLIDPVKYPNAFRAAPSNTQWDEAVRIYCKDVIKSGKIALIGDTSGYGVSAVKDSVATFAKDGMEIAYRANIDPTQTDVTPDLIRARAAGAQAIVLWCNSAGLVSRLLNTRATLDWDIPVLGHPSLSSGEIGALLAKPANWNNVYAIGFRSASYGPDGRLPPKSEEFLQKYGAKVSLKDTLLWWVTSAYDTVNLIADAVRNAGPSSEEIIGYWNGLKDHQGYFGTYSYSPTDHNGYDVRGVVMSAANSGKNGTFALAPGYV